MRKKELLKIAPKEPSQKLISAAAGDGYERRQVTRKVDRWRGINGWSRELIQTEIKTYKTRWFFTAKEENGILVIAVHYRDKLAGGKMDPGMVVYIDIKNEEWTTRTDEKWSKGLLTNIIERPLKTDWSFAEDVCDEEDMQMVNSRLKTAEDSIYDAVAAWQARVRERENVRKAEKRAEYWHQQMEKVPALPEDFDDWVRHDGTLNSNFIFYKRAGKETEAYCTHCETTFTTRVKMVHNVGKPGRYDYEEKHKYMCPNCNAILTTKAWGKHKELNTQDYVVIMQPAGEYVVFRKFMVLKHFRRLNDFPRGEIWWSGEYMREELRVLASPVTFNSIESYEQRTVPILGRCMWASVMESAYTPSDRTPMNIGEGIPYLKNMEEALQNTSVRPVVAQMFMKRSSAYIQGTLREAASKRYVEYLVRAGLSRLAHQVVNGYPLKINSEAKNLKDLLGLDGQQLYELKQVNGDKNAVLALRYVKKHGEKLDRETLQFISNMHVNPEDLPLQRTGMKLQRMVRYIAKQAQRDGVPFNDMLRTYRDYLTLAFERGMNQKDEIVCHTPRIREFHDGYAEEKNIEAAKKATRDLNAKFSQISARFEENREHFRYERSGLVIMVPTCAGDIKMEGALQHHCVGASDRYMSRMNSGESYILFLRKKEDPQKPYYTLEVEYDGKVRQSYGAYDRKPDWEKVEPVLMGFTRQIGKRLEREQKEAVLVAAG